MEESQEFPILKSRSKNWTEDEKHALTQAIRERHGTLFGKFGPNLTSSHKAQTWKEVVECVNACGIETRSLTQCQEKYKTLKKEVKAAAAKNKKVVKKTGGGSPEYTESSASAENILATIPKVAIEGIVGGIDTSELEDPIQFPTPCLAMVVANSTKPSEDTSSSYQAEANRNQERKENTPKTPKRPKLQSVTEMLLEEQVSLFREQLECMKSIKDTFGKRLEIETEKLQLKREKVYILRQMLELQQKNEKGPTVPTFPYTSVSGASYSP